MSDTTSATTPDTTRRRLSTDRKLVFALVPVVLLVAACEALAWWVDSHLNFRYELLQGWQQTEFRDDPVRALHDADLPWPESTIRVRSSNDPQQSAEPYTVGGQTIAAAQPRQNTLALRPDDIARLDRRWMVVVGGSAALGFPYPYAETFSGRLEQIAVPQGRGIVNCAQRGWLSGEVVALTERAVRMFAPEVLIVMSGNNEWVHWQMPLPELMRTIDGLPLRRVLARSRLLAAAQYWALRRAVDRQHARRNAGDAYSPGYELQGYSYAARFPLERYMTWDGEAWLQTKRQFLDVFSENLTQAVEFAQAEEVEVVLLSLPFNYKLSPAWKHPQPESFVPEHRESVRSRIHRAVKLCDAGQSEQALVELDAALTLDPYPPLAHYLRGHCLEQLGHPLEAEAAYAQCREHMVGNLGALPSINRRIEEVAASTGARFIDLRARFDAYSHARGRYFNVDLIHDDCHPTPEGHAIITEALAEALGFAESPASRSP